MNKTNFDDFVHRQRAKQEEETKFNPQKELQDWLKHLESLYSKIKIFMKNYLESGDAKIEIREIQLNEEFVGVYTADKLILTIGRSTVTFTPIGTMLIGSKGRVDVQGPRGVARLGLVNKMANSARQQFRVMVSVNDVLMNEPPPSDQTMEIEWVWKIITPPPEMKFIELTQEAFFEMILSVADA